MRIPAVRLAFSCLLFAACSDDAGVRATDPTMLSSRGLYTDIAKRKVVSRAFEYRPDYALWSDGADKRRWIVLPEGGQIDSTDMAHWAFPLGTKFFKEFSRGGKLLETRLIERVKETGFVKNDYFMGTFIWRADQSDAILTDAGKDNVLGTEHDVPRQKQCLVCHRGEPGGVLGFSAVQLSASGTLAKVERRGWLSDEPGRSFELPGDAVEKAALGAMHANCGHCHAESGMADFMHLRVLPEEADRPVEALDAYKTTVGIELSDEWEDHPERFTQRIVPGDPDASAIAYRMSQRGDDVIVPDQMPPLATTKVDDDGLAAVRAWIESLAGVPLPDDGGVGDAGEVDAGLNDAAVADAGPGAGVRDSGSAPAADGGRPVSNGPGPTAAGTSGGTGEAGASPPVGPAENPPVMQPGAAGQSAPQAGADASAAGAGGAGGASGATAGESPPQAGAGAAGESAPQAGAGASGGSGAAGEAGAGVGGTAGVGVQPAAGAGSGGAGAGGEVVDAGVEDAGSSPDGAAGSGDHDVSVDEAAEHDAEHNAPVDVPPPAMIPPDSDPQMEEAAEHDAQTDESADHDSHADEGG